MFRRNVRWTFRRNTYAIDVPGFQGAEPSGKFRNSPKAGSGAEWLATLRNLPVISPPLNQHQVSNILLCVIKPKLRWQWFCGAGTDCKRKRKSPHSIDFSFLKQAGHAPLRCEVSDNHVPYPALYSFLRLACSIHPSASAFLLYFPVISVFLFLDLFPFLLKDIKIAVINISPIHNVWNAITAIVFFCYSVFVKLFLTVSLFSCYCYFITI